MGKRDKANNRTATIKAGFWFTICNILTKGIGFFTTPIFTRLLTKGEFGDYNNFTTWTGILLFVTSLNLEASLIRARFEFEDDLDNYVGSMTCLSMLSTLFWLVVFAVFIGPAQKLLSMNQAEIYAMFLYLLFYPVIQIFQTRERFEYRYKNTIIITLLLVAGTAVLSVLLVFIMSNKLAGRIIGTVVPVVLIGAVLLLLVIRSGARPKLAYWKFAIPFTIPFIPHLLSMYLLGSMDKVMIKKMCGAEDLALYSLAYTVGTIVSLLINSMNNAFSPWMGEQLAKKEYGELRKVSVPYIGIFVIFSFVALLIAPEILLALGGKSYSNAVDVIPPVFAGCLMQFIYCMYVNIEQFEKKTIGMAVASTTAAIFNFVTNAIFIKRYGYVAAAYTTFASYFLLMVLHMLLVKRIGKSGIFKDKLVLLLGIASSVLYLCTRFLLLHSYLRFVVFVTILAILSFIAYKNKKVIKNCVKRR